MLTNLIQEIRECCHRAAHCVQKAEAQNDPKVQQQLLHVTRLWLLLAIQLTHGGHTWVVRSQVGA